MLQKFYNARGSLVLFDTTKNIVTDQHHKRLFPTTPARVDTLISLGSLSPYQESKVITSR